jgi:hypothetical protein
MTDPDARSQFRKQSGQLFGDWNLPFDIKSAMFYESDLAAKSPHMKVMKAKSGEELRCKPHLCPTELDIIKINTVYNCHNYKTNVSQVINGSAINNSLTSNSTHSCSSLKWKTRKQFEEKENPVISRKSRDENHFICRALTFNGELRSGETNSDNTKCIITSSAFGFGFSWTFIDYEILVNPLNITIKWQEIDDQNIGSISKQNFVDSVLVERNNENNVYVTKCSKSKSLLKYLRFCLISQILKC